MSHQAAQHPHPAMMTRQPEVAELIRLVEDAVMNDVHHAPALGPHGDDDTEEPDQDRDSETKAFELSTWEKGFEFEQYTVNKFSLQDDFFELMEWRGDKRTNRGVFAKSNQYPDLQYRFHFPKHIYMREFAVECKFRSSDFNNGIIKLCKLKTLDRYRRYQEERNTKVYVYIGLGGYASAPQETYLVPLDDIPDNFIHQRDLKPYQRKHDSKFFFDHHTHTLK